MIKPTFAGAAALLVVSATPAAADTQTFAGPYASTRAEFELAAGCDVKLENFDSFANGAAVGEMPGVDAVMTDENAAGNSVGLPIIAGNTPVTAPNWVVNFGNGRPAFSPWVIRPVKGEAIYAFGQANGQGDWVLIEGYDINDDLVVSVEAPILTPGFAGFVTDTPIYRVVVTPVGNGDGLNGMDNVQVSIVAPAACPGDFDDDGTVGSADLAVLLSAWGTDGADLSCDGDTDASDLATLLGAWGSCR